MSALDEVRNPVEGDDDHRASIPVTPPATPDPTVYRPETVSAPWAVVVRSFAFLRKEVVEIFRQPRLLALLVAGPFVLLLLFGSAYGNNTMEKRTLFVGPDDSVYGEVLADYEDDLGDFVKSEGMISSLDDAMARLDAGEVDVVVVFPDDPEASVLSGERAQIQIFHDEIDPIQQGAIQIAGQLAIQEVNATVLTTLATDAQEALAPAAELSDEFAALADRLAQDPVGTRDELRPELDQARQALDGSVTILDRLDPEDRSSIDDLEATRQSTLDVIDGVEAIDETTSDAELQQLSDQLATLAEQLDQTVVLDPAVLVRPFEADTENIVDGTFTPTAYFTPGSLALLLQHLALTFAALSLVRDRRTGLFELMRVGPLSSIEIVIGKVFAYLLVGCVVAVGLVAAAVLGLGVTFAGSYAWMAVIVVGVLLASLALGMGFAIIARSESQAVQFAMLSLLGGLFFSGFMLPLDTMRYPAKGLSYLLPVTYGIDGFQDIMLRGATPAPETLIGLATIVVVFGAIAVLGLRRQLRTSAG